MIDALFGSKTRVKLLHLFLNNPGKAFYVREITRLIDEQINSVRRELANMLEVGIITSDSADNKLYYEVSQRYEYYIPLRAIFADDASKAVRPKLDDTSSRLSILQELDGARIIVLSGVFVNGSISKIDVLLVGNTTAVKVQRVIKVLERNEGRELNYSLMSYEDFYYRLSVRDKFITEILNGRHTVLVDTDNVLKSQS